MTRGGQPIPIFEFVCGRCGGEFERLVSGASQKVACPACGGRKVARKFSTFGSRSSGKFTSSKGGGCSSCAKSSCTSCK